MAHETLTFRPSKKNENILAELAKLAEQDNRSLNNYIENIFVIWAKNNPLNVGGEKNNKTAKRNVKSKD